MLGGGFADRPMEMIRDLHWELSDALVEIDRPRSTCEVEFSLNDRLHEALMTAIESPAENATPKLSRRSGSHRLAVNRGNPIRRYRAARDTWRLDYPQAGLEQLRGEAATAPQRSAGWATWGGRPTFNGTGRGRRERPGQNARIRFRPQPAGFDAGVQALLRNRTGSPGIVTFCRLF
jgi:hypothetical protein